MPADRITVEGIEFHGFHGVPAAEREIGHRYRVDLHMELDLRPSAAADDVALTVDYGEAARVVIGIGTDPSVRLVETLAERMAAELLERFPLIDAVEIRVAKIHPPVPIPCAASIIQIRRDRSG
jgi:7,8-dihydroneopterin aldolase/epimerase/oxygenase